MGLTTEVKMTLSRIGSGAKPQQHKYGRNGGRNYMTQPVAKNNEDMATVVEFEDLCAALNCKDEELAVKEEDMAQLRT